MAAGTAIASSGCATSLSEIESALMRKAVLGPILVSAALFRLCFSVIRVRLERVPADRDLVGLVIHELGCVAELRVCIIIDANRAVLLGRLVTQLILLFVRKRLLLPGSVLVEVLGVGVGQPVRLPILVLGRFATVLSVRRSDILSSLVCLAILLIISLGCCLLFVHGADDFLEV